MLKSQNMFENQCLQLSMHSILLFTINYLLSLKMPNQFPDQLNSGSNQLRKLNNLPRFQIHLDQQLFQEYQCYKLVLYPQLDKYI
ncbi:hypothetical protein pb186bvf_013842 [Paramecium bursaria]